MHRRILEIDTKDRVNESFQGDRPKRPLTDRAEASSSFAGGFSVDGGGSVGGCRPVIFAGEQSAAPARFSLIGTKEVLKKKGS